MEENKTFWNKTAAELTVKDQLVVSLALPIIVVGGMVVTGAAFSAWDKASDKFKKIRSNRNNKNTEA